MKNNKSKEVRILDHITYSEKTIDVLDFKLTLKESEEINNLMTKIEKQIKVLVTKY